VVGAGETFYENVSLCGPPSDDQPQAKGSSPLGAVALASIILSTILLLLGISVLIVFLLKRKNEERLEDRRPGYSLVSGMTDFFTSPNEEA
jgi:hypothetical protein